MALPQKEPDRWLADAVHLLLLRLGLLRTVQAAYELPDVFLWPFPKKLRERGVVSSRGRLAPGSAQLRRYLCSR